MADNVRLSLLNYDIHRKSFRNGFVADIFRRYGVYMSESVVVLLHGREPWEVLNGMTEAKVTWHLVPFAPEATPVVLEIATAYMRKTLTEKMETEGESLGRADATLEAVEQEHQQNSDLVSGETVIEARKAHAKQYKAIMRRTEKLVRDLEHACHMFGIDTSKLPELSGTANRIAGLRSLNGARATHYVQMASRAKQLRLNVETSGDNAIPAGMLMDALEDRDEDMNAQRAAFEQQAPVGTVNPAEIRSSLTNEHRQERPRVNGNHPPRPVVDGSRDERQFSLNNRFGRRTVVSRFTDGEAASLLYGQRGNAAADIARRVRSGRSISVLQRNVLHVLAVEEYERQLEAARAQGEVQTVEQPTVSQGDGHGRRNGSDTDAAAVAPLPVESTKPVPREVNTKDCIWTANIKTLTIDASQVGYAPCDKMPQTVEVRSHLTGAVQLFSLTQVQMYGDEDFDGESAEIIGWKYGNPNGVTLMILND